MKTCVKCNLEKEHFTKNECKDCVRIYNKAYNLKNKEAVRKQQKEYYTNNKQEILQYHQEYYLDNKGSIIKYQIEYEKNKRLSDPAFKLRKNCSTLIRVALKGNKSKSSILDYLPYTMTELKSHLENQFDAKMSWDNYGSYWHIDHIMPQSGFVFTSMSDESFKKCWDLNNLRPLEAIENIRKSNKVPNVPK